MWSVPDGYGSISSWYQCRSSAACPGFGFGTANACSRSQTSCHLASISLGSYRSIVRLRRQKSLSGKRGRGELPRRAPRLLPGLLEKPLHWEKS
jgi:hypothetical protein